MTVLDNELFLFFNSIFSGPIATSFFSWITHLGNGLVAAALIVVPMYLFDREKLRKHLLPLVLSVALSGAAVNIIKPIVNRPRPADYFSNTDIVVYAPVGTPSDKSFPSGHTQTAFGAAAYISCIYPLLSPLFISLAVLTGLSRIAIGVHFPSDVLVGALFGILFSIIGYRTQKNYRARKKASGAS